MLRITWISQVLRQTFGDKPDDGFDEKRAYTFEFFVARIFTYEGKAMQIAVVALLELADEVINAVI